ncbi:TetR family transcriptional regulator [Xaviernesmea oryzae]|uniref:TetR family transcriptional regulator n=1 Tax=Xaviernesmea oryzae TaxID=464029 RepID=A0A1Q9B3H4_9HYPH|nr:TetR/AcrR family transcriptional regulator [Xaviernesmea oryzae]OLP62597.1 TetR family transcriptional regulator [Xaviernesmea oryzae]SEM26269.1 transcriptional regulator, TetR family [Xaviernesmea oryzae]
MATRKVADNGGGEHRPAKRDPEGVRRDILSAAMEEFSLNGLSGGRIDEIAARTRTSKRMIYYYFGDKERLYERVLEEAYGKVRGGESDLGLDALEPVAALTKLCRFTFDHHRANPAFIRMVMIENIHHGRHLQHSETIRGLNRPAIEALETVLLRGQAEGQFRKGLEALELHWQISALSFFNVSNRATFTAIFGDGLFAGDGQEQLSRHVAEMVLRYVLTPDHVGAIAATGE